MDNDSDRRESDGPNPLGNALRVLRTAQRWKQEELARALGVAPSQVSGYEKGARLTREILIRAVEAMGLPREAIDWTLSFLRSLGFATRRGGPPDDDAELARRDRARFAAELARFWEGSAWAAFEMFDRRLEVYEERRQAAALWARLRSRPPETRRTLVRGSREYQAWGLAELLADESLKAAGDDADRAVELAELAVLVADLTAGDEAWRSKVRGYAEAHLGNALRVRGDLRGAECAFARATEMWERGAGASPAILNDARLPGLESSLRRARRDFGGALKLLDRALALDQGDLSPHLLINKSRLLRDMGDLEGALEVSLQAEALLSSVRDLRLVFVARFNVVDYLSLLGRHEEAVTRLPEVWRLAEVAAGALDRVRLVWVQGRVAAGTGQEDEGIASLEQTGRDFAARHMPYDSALVSLELAALRLERGETGKVKDLVREMAPIFESQEVHREALAALALFRRAAERERASAELAHRVLGYLRQARNNPSLRFESGEPDHRRRTRGRE